MTERIYEYKIVKATGCIYLAEAVMALIHEDWQPLGGPTFRPGIDCYWAQAMVRYSE